MMLFFRAAIQVWPFSAVIPLTAIKQPTLLPLLSIPSLHCLRLSHSVTCVLMVSVPPLERWLSEGVLSYVPFYLCRWNSTWHTQAPSKCLMKEWTAWATHQSVMTLLLLNIRFLCCEWHVVMCRLVRSFIYVNTLLSPGFIFWRRLCLRFLTEAEAQ